MDIFPNLLGEAEFRYFTETDYACLGDILNDSLAKYLKDYMASPDADKDIVQAISTNIGDLVDGLTFHYTLMDMGIIDLIGRLTPETLITSGADYADIYSKLKYLEDNIGKLRTTIPARSKTAYSQFILAISGVLHRMKLDGTNPTYPNISERIESNKFVFYVPNDKGHNTGTGIVNSHRRQWVMCLRGLEYKNYCDSNGLNYIVRRLF